HLAAEELLHGADVGRRVPAQRRYVGIGRPAARTSQIPDMELSFLSTANHGLERGIRNDHRPGATEVEILAVEKQVVARGEEIQKGKRFRIENDEAIPIILLLDQRREYIVVAVPDKKQDAALAVDRRRAPGLPYAALRALVHPHADSADLEQARI